MKIGILTLPLNTNYGGILQAYALQTTLSRLGHEVTIINRTYPLPTFKIKCRRILTMLKAIYKLLIKRDKDYRVMNPFNNKFTNRSGHTILPFVKEFIKMSPVIYTSDELTNYIRFMNFDCCIVGSDQVWRKSYSPQITDYFLDCITDHMKVKRVAYAASFGIDEWEYDAELTSKISILLNKFDAVSVREKSGVDLCKDFLGIEVKCVLDPTLLLTKHDYMRLYNNTLYNKVSYKSKMMCYLLDRNQDAFKIINQISKVKGYIPLFSKLYGHTSEYSLQMSVEEWLKAIAASELLITDSFHACVFSIIFEKPFIVIGNTSRGITRIQSLLNDYELQNRLVVSYENFVLLQDELLKENNIDYEKVSKIINERIDYSRNLLINSIN